MSHEDAVDGAQLPADPDGSRAETLKERGSHGPEWRPTEPASALDHVEKVAGRVRPRTCQPTTDRRAIRGVPDPVVVIQLVMKPDFIDLLDLLARVSVHVENRKHDDAVADGE